MTTIYGHDDQARFEQPRANEARATADLLAKIRTTEPAATRVQTVALFSDVAAAAHEGMLARRAADRVKIDYDAESVEAKLTDDQRTAAKALAKHAAIEKLLVGSKQPVAADRRTLGILFAMDRMEMARGLPKALKFYAVAHVFTAMFDVAPPPLTLSPTSTPKPGAWLAYLSSVAARAGHPSLDATHPSLTDREMLAWTGVSRGFADRLRRQANELPPAAVPELSRIANAVAKRLETERATAKSITKAHAQLETTPRKDHSQ